MGSKKLVGFVSILSTPRLRHLIRCDSDTSLPFHLVVKTPAEELSYTPKNDFHLKINAFPHLLLEVNPQSSLQKHTETIPFRMLLQAACICRIGNWLRASTTGRPIIIMALYIDNDYKAHQHLLYQPDLRSAEVEFNWLTGSLCLMQYLSRLNTSPRFSI